MIMFVKPIADTIFLEHPIPDNMVVCPGGGPISVSMTFRPGRGFWAEMLSVARTSKTSEQKVCA